MVQKKYIIFSDLDGTLLDHNTYSFSAAAEALNLIRKKKASLVLVSSKTRTEMAYYQKKLGLAGLPFVVENGAAVYTSPGYFADMGEHRDVGHMWCYQHGPLYQELVSILNKISKKYGQPSRGFHNATEQEIAVRTGLKGKRLKTAMEREFSVPLFYDEKTERILKNEISDHNLRILHGGRFMHVLGNLDKGTAVKMLTREYRQKHVTSEILLMAIGDSQNDLAMMDQVDYPVLVKKPGGDYESAADISNINYSPFVGPAGWNDSVIKFLS